MSGFAQTKGLERLSKMVSNLTGRRWDFTNITSAGAALEDLNVSAKGRGGRVR